MNPIRNVKANITKPGNLMVIDMYTLHKRKIPRMSFFKPSG